jgi:hypothetical protein
MGNNNITAECCSDRNQREHKMAGRFERPEFSNNISQSTPTLLSSKLENGMLDPLRKTYDKTFLQDVENTLNFRKSKGKSMNSEVSNNLKNKILSERSGCGSSTFGDCDKLKIVTVEKSNSIMKYLKQDDYSSNVSFYFETIIFFYPKLLSLI